MERLTTRHSNVAVIKDKSKIKEAMELLARYEETNLTPEEVASVNDFVKSGIADLLKKIYELENKHKWIPAEKKLPPVGTTALVTVRHRRWISDLQTEDEVDHPEYLEVCSAYREDKYFIKLDDSQRMGETYVPIVAQEEDIEYPIEEVIAWMSLPDAYEGE